MNIIKKMVFVSVFAFVASIGAMELISHKSYGRIGASRQEQATRYKSEIVWVKTLDNVVMEVPQWQIDQMKEVQQAGENSKENPAKASMVTSGQLLLIQEALQKASNLEVFRRFYSGLSDDQQKSLLADAFTLGMQGLASLLITYMFPVDVQQQMGSAMVQQAGVIAPIVEYLQNPEKIPLSHKGSVVSIALSPDGNRIISGAAGVDHNLILYDLKHGKEIKNLVPEILIFPRPCVAFSPDGKYIVTGGVKFFDNLILWDGVTGEEVKKIGGYKDRTVDCIAFSSDSKYIIAGSKVRNNTFNMNNPTVYDIKTGSVVHGFNDNQHPVGAVTFNHYGNELAIGYVDITSNLALYDSKTYKLKRVYNVGGLNSNCLAFSPNGNHILVGSYGKLILINYKTDQLVESFKYNNDSKEYLTCVEFSPGGEYIAVGLSGKQNNLALLNGKTGELMRKVEGYNDSINCVAFSPDGNALLCGGKQGLLLFKLISPQTLNYIATQLNLAQARLLYRLYVAKINKVPVIMDSKDLDYQLYLTLPADVQRVVKAFLPFELASDLTEKQIQEKMNELRTALYYHTSRIWGRYEKKRDEKIKAVKDAMQEFDKNSVDYKACERLLIELEQEAAFDV